jgi:hypothetical protein
MVTLPQYLSCPPEDDLGQDSQIGKKVVHEVDSTPGGVILARNHGRKIVEAGTLTAPKLGYSKRCRVDSFRVEPRRGGWLCLQGTSSEASGCLFSRPKRLCGWD